MDSHKIPDYFRTNLFLFGGGASYALETDGQFFPFASAGLSFLAFKTNGIGDKNKKYVSPAYYSLGLDGDVGVHITFGNSFILSLSGGYHYITVDLLDGIAAGKYNDFYVTGSVGIAYAFSFGNKYKKAEPKLPGIQPKPTEQPPPVAANKAAEERKSISVKITSLDSLVKGIKRVEKLSDIPSVKDTSGHNAEQSLAYNEKAEPAKEETGTDKVSENVRKEKSIPPVIPVKKKVAERNPPKANDINTPEVVRPKKEEKLPKEILLHGELTFVRDETTIQPEAFSKLDEIAQTMKAHPGVKWRIEAYTDNHGSEKELQKFTQKRALAIVKYLTSKGISASQLKAVGEGSKNPVEDNENVWGRMMNRRVIIKRID